MSKQTQMIIDEPKGGLSPTRYKNEIHVPIYVGGSKEGPWICDIGGVLKISNIQVISVMLTKQNKKERDSKLRTFGAGSAPNNTIWERNVVVRANERTLPSQ